MDFGGDLTPYFFGMGVLPTFVPIGLFVYNLLSTKNPLSDSRDESLFVRMPAGAGF